MTCGSPAVDILCRRKYSVYWLRDPRTNEVRYIGISSNLALREATHRQCAFTATWKWAKGLRVDGLLPLFEIVSPELERHEAIVWEVRLVILHSIMYPGRLLNKPKRLRRHLVRESDAGKTIVGGCVLSLAYQPKRSRMAALRRLHERRPELTPRAARRKGKG